MTNIKTLSKNLLPAMLALLTVAALRLPALFAGAQQQRKIVVFSPDALNDAAQDELIAHVGGVKIKNLDLIDAKVVLLPSKASERALAQHPAVLRIDDDAEMRTLAQVLPWGIDRIDAEMIWPTGNNADAVKVAVIDTGISASHPDLAANIKGGVNTINSKKSWNDDNGHGSHVAGTVGALNNTAGVVGAAPLVNLYAVKVLNRNGSGWISDIIEGIQWAVNNGMQVANMSFGGSSDVQSMHDALIAAYNAGVVLVAATGNSGGGVGSPAACPEVIAVSATDSSNSLASFSSFGPEVDLAAPGVSIYSTYKGSSYATLSGTSMAAPHVTGSAALVLNNPVDPLYDTDLDGAWDPAEVQQKLQDTATNLGDLGFDNLFGWGLVNAFNATLP